MGCAHPNAFAGAFGCALCGTPRNDGWASLLNGLGTEGADKRESFTFGGVRRLSAQQGINLWRGSDMAERAVGALPEEETRVGYNLTVGGNDETSSLARAEEVTDLWDRFDVLGLYRRGREYERACGGGAILIGANDGQKDLSKPLNIDRIQTLDYLTTMECRELMPLSWYMHPSSPRYGFPEIYTLNPIANGAGRTVDPGLRAIPRIHESRLIVFDGIRCTRQDVNSGWGDSVFTRNYDILRDFDLAWASFAGLLPDHSQAVFKIKDLANIVGTNNIVKFVARFRAIELSRSIARAIVIDETESFERKSTSFAGLPEVYDRAVNRLAGSLRMPVTILMGEEPSGMNATGAGSIRNWYATVAASQTRHAIPKMRRLSEIFFKVTGNKVIPPKFKIEAKPLWQATEKEDADSRLVQAQIDKLYYDMGVLSPEEIAANRFTRRGYSYATMIDFAAREKAQALDNTNDTITPPDTESETDTGGNVTDPSKSAEAGTAKPAE